MFYISDYRLAKFSSSGFTATLILNILRAGSVLIDENTCVLSGKGKVVSVL
jgi:hypothetical protein